MEEVKEITTGEISAQLSKRLTEYWDSGRSAYSKAFQKMRVLDMTDRGEMWKAIGAKFPKYQILPDTNHVSYIKNNLLASIYSVTKSAEILPTSENDKDLCVNLNVILDCLWDTQNVGMYQFQAGERAALYNVGYTQVGWDEEILKSNGIETLRGNIRLKNIDPMKFMRDPYAVDLDEAEWCCTYDDYPKSLLLGNSLYADEFKKFLQGKNYGETMDTPQSVNGDGLSISGAKDYYTVIIWWLREKDKIMEVHTLLNKHVLHKKESIAPAVFPIAPLYCNLPVGALVGTSEPARIFANNVAYNMMDSIALTAEYKNQQPPKFISDQSKLNVNAFSKYGDEANHTFVVSGDATKAVHYHQFPQPSNFLTTLKMSLEDDIQSVTGIDGRYTGRNTGSITTTGGTKEMLDRVTLVDVPKITLYESYCKRLTELILLNLQEHCPKRTFFRKKPNSTKYETVTVDFPSLDASTLFQYRMSISSELPKNKQRIAAMATELLKEQYQYNQNGSGTVNWITEEEWLMFQDIPMKEYMLERMGVQRMENTLEEVAQVLYQYADLVKNGATSDQAMQATAETLNQTRQGTMPNLAAGANPELEMMANNPM